MDNREREPQPPTDAEAPVVLIVDDETAIAETLAVVVADAGYIPLVASNGLRALELARTRWPALVLTDMMMPLLDGAGLVSALRGEATSNHRRMPRVIILTAGGMAEARAIGADVVLRKPFDIAVLDLYIARLLSR